MAIFKSNFDWGEWEMPIIDSCEHLFFNFKKYALHPLCEVNKDQSVFLCDFISENFYQHSL